MIVGHTIFSSGAIDPFARGKSGAEGKKSESQETTDSLLARLEAVKDQIEIRQKERQPVNFGVTYKDALDKLEAAKDAREEKQSAEEKKEIRRIKSEINNLRNKLSRKPSLSLNNGNKVQEAQQEAKFLYNDLLRVETAKYSRTLFDQTINSFKTII